MQMDVSSRGACTCGRRSWGGDADGTAHATSQCWGRIHGAQASGRCTRCLAFKWNDGLETRRAYAIASAAFVYHRRIQIEAKIGV
jgi:hypothetical protein